MQKSTVADPRAPHDASGTTATAVAGTGPRHTMESGSPRLVVRRGAIGPTPQARVDAGPAAHPIHPARRASRRRFSLPRIESPERVVPMLVAAFLLLATLTAAPAALGGTGATQGVGSAPRLVVGGDQGPNTGALDNALIDGGIDGSGTVGAIDGSGTRDPMIIAETAGASDVAGQFLEDGTLLKPVVVETNVIDSSDKLRTYRVRPGDTLTGIARRMGVSMMTIWWANHLKAKNDLKIGQTLVIPPVDGLVVTVKAGDSIESIAKAKGLSVDEIAAYNSLEDRTLVIGQVLILPGALGKAIATPKPTPRPVSRVIATSNGGSRTPSRPIVRTPPEYSGGIFAWPVPGGHISQYFHYGHPAIDIAAPLGTSIVAAAGGTVIYAGWKSNGGGYQVWIAHGSGLYTTYNHMSSVSVSVGEHVGRAQFVGRVGSTGNSTGPHCHFEVWRGPVWSGGVRVNPLLYF